MGSGPWPGRPTAASRRGVLTRKSEFMTRRLGRARWLVSFVLCHVAGVPRRWWRCLEAYCTCIPSRVSCLRRACNYFHRKSQADQRGCSCVCDLSFWLLILRIISADNINQVAFNRVPQTARKMRSNTAGFLGIREMPPGCKGGATKLWPRGAAARRQDLPPTHTLADADLWINSVAWAPDGRLAAGGADHKVRVYDKAGLGGLGGWFLSYCATPLVLVAGH